MRVGRIGERRVGGVGSDGGGAATPGGSAATATVRSYGAGSVDGTGSGWTGAASGSGADGSGADGTAADATGSGRTGADTGTPASGTRPTDSAAPDATPAARSLAAARKAITVLPHSPQLPFQPPGPAAGRARRRRPGRARPSRPGARGPVAYESTVTATNAAGGTSSVSFDWQVAATCPNYLTFGVCPGR